VNVAAGCGGLRLGYCGRRLGADCGRLGLGGGCVDVGVAGGAGQGCNGLRCLCRGVKRDYCRRQECGQSETGKHGEGSLHDLQQPGEDSRASARGPMLNLNGYDTQTL
jgi:hypothetical protein